MKHKYLLGFLALIAKPVLEPIVKALWGDNKTTNEILADICAQIKNKMPIVDSISEKYVEKLMQSEKIFQKDRFFRNSKYKKLSA